MLSREDATLQLFVALLYFVSIYIVADVFIPEYALTTAFIGQGIVMVGYLVLRAFGLEKPGPVMGIYITLGVALLAFGVIWQVTRGILRSFDQWPLDQP